MSAVASPPRLAQLPLVPSGGSSREQLRSSGGGRLTLGQQLDRAWEGLHATGATECPMCGAAMERAGHAGRCGGCGTTLA